MHLAPYASRIWACSASQVLDVGGINQSLSELDAATLCDALHTATHYNTLPSWIWSWSVSHVSDVCGINQRPLCLPAGRHLL